MSLVQNCIKMPWGDELPISACCPNDIEGQIIIAYIYDAFGVKALFKPSVIRRFGKTTNADSGVKTTLATFGTVGTPNIRETYSTTNDIDEICSSSADDTESILIEGATINTLGHLTTKNQVVTLNGQTPVAIPVPIARCTRMSVWKGTFASPANDLVGDIYVYDSSGTTVTAGVPQTNTTVKCRITAGENHSEKAAASVPNNEFWYIREIQSGVSRNAAAGANIDVDIEYKELGGVFIPIGLENQLRTNVQVNITTVFQPGNLIPSNSDVEMIAISDTADMEISGYVNGPVLSAEWTYDTSTHQVTFD